jgi:N-acetylglucosaminyl-diphospho-decaprenol L-rhamnosyltransferase
VRAATWHELGGFCEKYTGYGGEDTDFGQIAASRGVALTWVGGAWAYHQYHPGSDPPVQHLDDILRNAAVFHRRWGWWPMTGWLREFERQGLIVFDPHTQNWRRSHS